MLRINSCQGDPPGPLEKAERETTARPRLGGGGTADAHDRRAGDGEARRNYGSDPRRARLSMGAYLRRRALGQRVRIAADRSGTMAPAASSFSRAFRCHVTTNLLSIKH